MPGGAKLCFKLRELRPARNVAGIELLKLGIVGQDQGQIRGADRSGEIIADKHAQGSGRDFFISARLLQFITPDNSLKMRSYQIDRSNFAAA